MPKPPPIDEKEFKTLWKGLPQSDKDFISALVVISEVLGDETLRYRELPPRLERVLGGVDRDTLFSVVTECLGRLLDAPAMDRVKRARIRDGKAVLAKAKKRAAADSRKTAKRAVATPPKAKRRRSK